MNNKIGFWGSRSRHFALGLILLLSGFATIEASSSDEKGVAPNAETAADRGVTIVVYDRFAPVDFYAESIREDLLRSAFYDAARRSDWLDEYEFEYNPVGDKSVAGSIELNVHYWRISPTGTYNFSASANYIDLNGEKRPLGTFHGVRLGISVFSRWDVGEQFSGSAEDAFRDVLRQIEREKLEA